MKTDYREYKLNKSEEMKFAIVGYSVAAGLFYLFYKNIPLALAGGMLAFFFKDEYVKHLKQKRNELMLLQFKDLLYAVSSSVATGRYMYDALREGEDYLKTMYKEDSPMIEELQFINNAIYENHSREEDILLDFAERTAIEDISNFVDVYVTTRNTGGDVQKIISDTSSKIMEKMQIKKEIETLMAQKRFEAKIVSLTPIIIMLFLNIFSPEYLIPMYETAEGNVIMTIALVGFVIAVKWIVNLTGV